MTYRKQLFSGALAACALLMQCATTETTAPTRVAVKNANTFTVATVTVKSSDGSKTATFSSIAAGATSAFQEISFPSLSSVSVSCDTNGCNAATTNLTDRADNTLTVTTNTAVGAPGVVNGGGSGGSGW